MKNLVNVVSNTTIILMYDELVPETFMINMAIFSEAVFCFPYETKNTPYVYNFMICQFLKNGKLQYEKGF